MKKRKMVLCLICIEIIALSFAGCGKTGAGIRKSSESAQTEELSESGRHPEEETDISVLSETSAETDETAEAAEPDETDETEEPSDETAEVAESSDEIGDASEPSQEEEDASPYGDHESISLDLSWEYASESQIHSGSAVMYKASENRKNIVVGVNAGHGTSGGSSVKTYCHPDHSAKTTGGTTSAGSLTAIAVSGGMTFADGTAESTVTLRCAQILRDKLLAEGYDVLMIRDETDVQLDNVARTVICNNVADCHIALHWDGDGLSYDKGCFYCSVPDGIKNMYPTSSVWQQDDALGDCLISGLSDQGCKINGSGSMSIDLTQTSYSCIPSVDIELGNAASAHDDATLGRQADGLVEGINAFFD